MVLAALFILKLFILTANWEEEKGDEKGSQPMETSS